MHANRILLGQELSVKPFSLLSTNPRFLRTVVLKEDLLAMKDTVGRVGGLNMGQIILTGVTYGDHEFALEYPHVDGTTVCIAKCTCGFEKEIQHYQSYAGHRQLQFEWDRHIEKVKNMTEKLTPHVYLTDRFFEAMAYATKWHKEQVRKSTNIAYISHPFGVAALIIEAGGDEDQAIAGLLHDVAEDCGGEERLTEIKALFGPRVAGIVRGCSHSLVADKSVEEDWLARRQTHINHLKRADTDTLFVTAADKTHNARAIATDKQEIGDEVWKRFNKKTDKNLILWYYDSIYEVLEEAKVTSKLLRPLHTAIEIMKG